MKNGDTFFFFAGLELDVCEIRSLDTQEWNYKRVKLHSNRLAYVTVDTGGRLVHESSVLTPRPVLKVAPQADILGWAFHGVLMS